MLQLELCASLGRGVSAPKSGVCDARSAPCRLSNLREPLCRELQPVRDRAEAS
jgi:hypothetical protein